MNLLQNLFYIKINRFFNFIFIYKKMNLNLNFLIIKSLNNFPFLINSNFYLKKNLKFKNLNLNYFFNSFFNSNFNLNIKIIKSNFKNFLFIPILINSLTINNTIYNSVQIFNELPFQINIDLCIFIKCITIPSENIISGGLLVNSDSGTCYLFSTSFILCHSASGPGGSLVRSNSIFSKYLCYYNCSTSPNWASSAATFTGYRSEINFININYCPILNKKSIYSSVSFEIGTFNLLNFNSSNNHISSAGSMFKVESGNLFAVSYLHGNNCSSDFRSELLLGCPDSAIILNSVFQNCISNTICEIYSETCITFSNVYFLKNNINDIIEFNSKSLINFFLCKFDELPNKFDPFLYYMISCNLSFNYFPSIFFNYKGETCLYKVNQMIRENKSKEIEETGNKLWLITGIIFLILLILGLIGGYIHWNNKRKFLEINKYTNQYPISDFINTDFGIQ